MPRTGKGFVGDAQLECGEGDKERSQQFMQSYALLHLKVSDSYRKIHKFNKIEMEII